MAASTTRQWSRRRRKTPAGREPGQTRCFALHVAVHEAGHVWSEGHSSSSADLMYRANNPATAVDSDAQAELLAVYGPYRSPCGTTSDPIQEMTLTIPDTGVETYKKFTSPVLDQTPAEDPGVVAPAIMNDISPMLPAAPVPVASPARC